MGLLKSLFISQMNRLTKKTGEDVTHYPNGNIGQRWNYVDGKLNGNSFIYYESGKLLGELPHKNDLLNGKVRLFYESGNPSDEIDFKDGKLDGEHSIFDFFKEKFISIKFINDKIINTNDYTEEIEEKEDICDCGDFAITYENNPPLEWEDEVELIHYLGEYVQESLNFLLDDGCKGRKYFEKLIILRRDKYNESNFTYQEDINGKVIDYHENGNISVEGQYNKGKEYGKWIFYYENGNILTEGEYKEGDKDGEWVRYHENGKIMIKEQYDNGVMVKTSSYTNE